VKKEFETIRREISMQTQKGRGRGFASMSSEKKREIASKGGKAAHALGTAHKWTSEEAQAAGRKGGSISRRRSKYTVQA
jgi:general stress protein YciG